MKLPNATAAVVDSSKVRDYLLNPAHAKGRGKALYFTAQGFDRSDWQMLAQALKHLARNSTVVATMESPHGLKYTLDGVIEGPGGKMARVRTVWIVDKGRYVPRLVTAFPTPA
jgi:hypothetical protein